MKKIIFVLLTALFILCITLPLIAAAETYEVSLPNETAQAAPTEEVEAPPDESATFGEPLTWKYLGTIAGAAALAMLIVQYTKAPLDYIWKIPTKLFVYVVCLAIMLVATAITEGLTADNALLVAVNALLAAITAYGGYEVTYKHLDEKKYVSKSI